MKKLFVVVIIVILLIISIYLCLKDKLFLSDTSENEYQVEESIDYSNYENKTITLNETSITSDNKSISIDESNLTITESGVYNITGTLNGSIIVDASKCNVKLVLNNTNITSTNGPAINIISAKNVTIEFVGDNYLEDSSSYTLDDTKVDAVIYSKADLVLTGNGKVTINGNYSDGIVSKDTLTIESGEYDIKAINNGIKGKDYVYIVDGIFTIETSDGIKSNNDEDVSLGYIVIENGTFNINSANDGIEAETNLIIKNGTFNIISGNGYKEAKTNYGSMFINNSSTDTESKKGIKAGNSIEITDGTFNINSYDDGVHSNGDIKITLGNFNISTGDDALHADNKLEINGGDINVEYSYEGLEGTEIYINGGNIIIFSTDDGVNAAGGNDSSNNTNEFRRDAFSSSTGTLYINGGNITINCSGDGLDANGSIYMTDGYVIVEGPTNAGNGALDYDKEFKLTGGTILAIGSQGMDQDPSTNSTQNILHFNTNNINSTITITDSNDNELISYTPSKNYSSIVYSSSDIKKGETYALKLGDNIYASLTSTDIISKYGSTNNMNGTMDRPNNMMRR